MFSYVQSEIYRFKKAKGFVTFLALIMLGIALTFLIVVTGNMSPNKLQVEVLNTISYYLDLGLVLVPIILIPMVYKSRGPQTQIIGYGMSRERHVIGDYLGLVFLILKFAVIMVIVSYLLYFGGRAIFPGTVIEESLEMFLLLVLRVLPATIAHGAIALGLTFATGRPAVGNTLYIFLLLLLPQLLSAAAMYNDIVMKILGIYEYSPQSLYLQYSGNLRYGDVPGGTTIGWLPYLGIMAIIIAVFMAIGIIFYKKKEI